MSLCSFTLKAEFPFCIRLGETNRYSMRVIQRSSNLLIVRKCELSLCVHISGGIEGAKSCSHTLE